jgi:hypothetical protein
MEQKHKFWREEKRLLDNGFSKPYVASMIAKMIEDEKFSKEQARVELEADMAREGERERIQMEMYDDPYLNWSGHR